MANTSSTIILSRDLPRATISDRLRRRELVLLSAGVYSTDVNRTALEIVRREWRTIVGRIFPEAVITDRSAPTASPVDGVLYLAHPRSPRHFELQGLLINARPGLGPLATDSSLPDGVHLASFARGLLENAEVSRAHPGARPRRLTRLELGEWVDRMARFLTEDDLVNLLEEVHSLADTLGSTAAARQLVDELIGAALGTHTEPVASRALSLRAVGLPYDSERLQQLDLLFLALRSSAPQSHDRVILQGSLLPFYEAYFSNYIEGTEFTVDEAANIVFSGDDPEGRPDDADDVRNTYSLVSDLDEMRRVANSPTDFVELLRSRHRILMAARPEKRPGELKERPNQAGAALFVHPALVRGTLMEGFGRVDELDTAWERAVYLHYLVAIVHPFDDGNGRLSRVMMNSELDHGDQARIIIPTVFRDDYIGALRRLSGQDDPTVLLKALRFAHDWTARIDFSDARTVNSQLTRTNAFNDEGNHSRLILPARSTFSLEGEQWSAGGADASRSPDL